MIGRFGPCPHCNAALAFLEGAAGSSLQPQCPTCHEVVSVPRATFLMRDTSRPAGPLAAKPLISPK